MAMACMTGIRFPARISLPHPGRLWRQLDPSCLMPSLIMRDALPALCHTTLEGLAAYVLRLHYMFQFASDRIHIGKYWCYGTKYLRRSALFWAFVQRRMNLLSMFRDNMSVPSSRIKQISFTLRRKTEMSPVGQLST
jgi:hypothetical protein